MSSLSKLEMERSLDRYLGCFGRFRAGDPICSLRCALNLRCAIEHDQNERFEILEELVSAGDAVMKIN
ncbi:MAG TPA: hypothetical protein VLT88_06460 [Desulfosarcina sp.]|nr:hypothetical protein [Desulfosarcina sp.]